MTDDAPASDAAPDRLVVRYSPRIQALRTLAILGVAALCALIPVAARNPGPQNWQVAGALIAGALIWAFATALRIRDRSPQAVVDTDGIYFRDWMVGTVPWENVDYIAHSSSIRRGIVASITRNRRKPYLLFRFVERPPTRPTVPPPFSWYQQIRTDFVIQEPVIQQYGLDTRVDDILAAIQAHIDHWRSHRAPDKNNKNV
jgi:hypothetical protein